MTSTPWQWVDLFSEGGPFLLAEVTAFRDWPGSDGGDDAIADLEAPGALVAQGEHTLCFFDPEDPGPMQLGWTDDRIVLVRWTPGDGSPSTWRDMDAAARTAGATFGTWV